MTIYTFVSLNVRTYRPELAMGMLADVKAHNIPGQRDVKLNELAKQILMLLPQV